MKEGYGEKGEVGKGEEWGKGDVVSAGLNSLSQLHSLTQRFEELWTLVREAPQSLQKTQRGSFGLNLSVNGGEGSSGRG